MRIRWTRPARRDLESIVDYVGQNNPRAAALLDRILERVETLAVHPELGRSGRVAGTRELVIADTPFLVPYRLRDDIEILAVFHGSRLWPGSFR